MGLIFIAVFIALLAGPILLEYLFDLGSKAVEKGAKGGFLLGLGVLAIGLVSGTRVLEIAGGALVGAVVLAVIADNYLTRSAQGSWLKGATGTAIQPSVLAAASWPAAGTLVRFRLAARAVRAATTASVASWERRHRLSVPPGSSHGAAASRDRKSVV